MLTASIDLTQRYDYLGEKLKRDYKFSRKKNLRVLPLGRADIDGDEVSVSVQKYTTMPADAHRYESHNRYFDIQYVAEGQEQFGCIRRARLLEDASYSETDDIVFLGSRDKARPSP